MDDNIQKVMDLLITKGPQTKKDIATILGIKKNTLSGYLDFLEEKGFIKTGGRGVPVEALVFDFYPELKTEDVIGWVVFHLLNQSSAPLSIAEIKKKYLKLTYEKIPDDIDNNAVLPSLNNYLHNLVDKGYIEQGTKIIRLKDGTERPVLSYKTTVLTPYTVHMSYDKLLDLFLALKTYSISETSDSLAQKIQWILDIDNSEIVRQQVYGKHNLFRKKSLKKLDLLFSTDYQDKRILIYYISRKGEKLKILLSVGAIVYSAETNEFYLLGETEQGDQITIIRLSSINSIVCSNERSTVYGNEKYKELVASMISVEGGEPFNVRIRFLDKPWIRSKLESYVSARKDAKLEYNHNGRKELLYCEDNVIGIRGLHRFVKSFGPNAIVIEPKELIDLLLDTSQRIEARYSEE